MKKHWFLLPLLTSVVSFLPEATYAAPIQCYIGAGGSYQICDFEQKGYNFYLIEWPDGDRTGIQLKSNRSGEYAIVGHANERGRIYNNGTTRYPRFHQNNGEEWLCLHKTPKGKIDFCITKP